MKTFFIFLLLCGFAHAEPFLICDAQNDATDYILNFPTISLIIVNPTEADGSIKYDLATWPAASGWFDGTAKFTGSYEIVDETTGNVSTIETESDPSPFRLRIPNNIKPANYKVQ